MTNSFRTKKARAIGIPTVDLSLDSSIVSEKIVNACKEFGFFKVINHSVDMDVVSRWEAQGAEFFAKPTTEKQRAGTTASPFGYGCKNIGLNGDMGELEYLTLHTNASSLFDRSISMSAANDYIEEAKELACEILDLAAEGLRLPNKYVFSRLIRDSHNDSVIRVNHYPCSSNDKENMDPWDPLSVKIKRRIGFGEHSDPQILTILRSNDVPGLQVCTQDGLWVSVPSDPTAFYAIVGDAFQALTNGKFKGVRHRALSNSGRARMSMMYFGAPAMNAWICPLPEMVTSDKDCKYVGFSWGEFKRAAYSLRLADSRLHLFQK
ncbi:Gibberellin 2-beta-dioxygenase 2 [Linum perenne]